MAFEIRRSTPNSVLQRKAASRDLLDLAVSDSAPEAAEANKRKWKIRYDEIDFKPRRHTAPSEDDLHPASLRLVASFGCAAVSAGNGRLSDVGRKETSGFSLEGREINLGHLLGKGASGAEVYLAECCGFTFAAKILPLFNVDETIEACRREIKLMERMEHDNIVKYLGHKFTRDSLQLYIAYYPATLYDIIVKMKEMKKSFTASQILNYMLQMCKGLEYLHNLPESIIHRDIKSQNVFVNLNAEKDISRLRLGDFDVSKILNEKNATFTRGVGTPGFIAPEVMKDDSYGKKIDIWSLGMVWYELMTLERPYFELDRKEYNARALSGERPVLDSAIQSQYSQFVSLWKSCTEALPEDRPSASELIGKLEALNVK